MCSGVLHKGHWSGPEKRRVLLQQVFTAARFHPTVVLHLNIVLLLRLTADSDVMFEPV